MSFHSLVDEFYIDLPDWYTNSYTFKSKLTIMALSKQGYMLGVGCSNGEIFVMDSDTGLGEKKIAKLDGPITSMSFSNDGHYLAANCKNSLQVFSLLKIEKVYETKVEEGITSCIFSPNDATILYFLANVPDKSLHRVNIEDGSDFAFGKQYSVFNILNNETIIAAYKAEVVMIPKSDEMIEDGIITPEAKRGIISIEVSNKQKYILVLDRSGNASLCEIADRECHRQFSDHVNRITFTSATFDRNDEHVLFGSTKVSHSSFTAYSTITGQMRKEYQSGPREETYQLLFHPLQPIIFSRGPRAIHIYRPVYKDRWANSLPEENNMEENEKYDEPEDEFDEGHESARPQPEVERADIPVDIFTRAALQNRPDERALLKMPVLREDIMQKSDEEEEGEEDYYDED